MQFSVSRKFRPMHDFFYCARTTLFFLFFFFWSSSWLVVVTQVGRAVVATWDTFSVWGMRSNPAWPDQKLTRDRMASGWPPQQGSDFDASWPCCLTGPILFATSSSISSCLVSAFFLHVSRLGEDGSRLLHMQRVEFNEDVTTTRVTFMWVSQYSLNLSSSGSYHTWGPLI